MSTSAANTAARAPSRSLPGVKLAVDLWIEAAAIREGRLLRSLNRHGQTTGSSLTPQAVLAAVRFYGKELGWKIQPHDLRRTCAKLCRSAGGELEQIQLLLGHSSILLAII